MTKKDAPPSPARRTPSTPWSNLERKATSLAVEDFPVTLIVQLGNALRRTVTTPYAEQCGLSEPEWRMFTLIVNFSPLNMVDLVQMSAADKAQVSRCVKALKEKGLIDVVPDPSGNLKRLVCVKTDTGEALHAAVFPTAQKKQAEILAPLTREERESFYRCLRKLNAHHGQQTAE